MKNFDHLPFNWFDVLIVLVLVLGLYRGRKRGMSLEVFSLLQWLLVVFVCAFTYEPLGKLLNSFVPSLSLLVCYIISYVTVASLLSILFISLKSAIGEKVVARETFGKAEYYLGMPAGLVRFGCVLLAMLAILNARYFTTAEIKAKEAYQKDMYGSEFFPGLSNLQQDVFERSLMGPSIKKYLSFMLIQSTPPGSNGTRPPVRQASLP